MKNLVQKAMLMIENEMNKNGFIDNSDNTGRVIDIVALKVAEEHVATDNEIDEDDREEAAEDLQQDLIEQITDEVKAQYNSVYELHECGDYEAYYFSKELNFDDIESFYNHFGIEG